MAIVAPKQLVTTQWDLVFVRVVPDTLQLMLELRAQVIKFAYVNLEISKILLTSCNRNRDTTI